MRRRYSFATVLLGRNSLRREGLAGILRAANFRVQASAASADELVACKAQPCHLLFLLVYSGDDLDAAFKQIELLKHRHPDGRIAIVADRYRLDALVSAYRAGVTGFFVDVMTSDAFIKSLELVMMGETVFPPAFLTFAFDSEAEQASEPCAPAENRETIPVSAEEATGPQLSPREKLILNCLVEGDSNKCIARKVDITEATVKVHVKAILRKIRVQNRTQAAIWGINNRSLGRPSGNGHAHGGPEARERHLLPVPAPAIHELKQVEALPPNAIDHEYNHIAGANRFIRKASRLRA
jgi:DNA-binding NarL/FixJ family response regulator